MRIVKKEFEDPRINATGSFQDHEITNKVNVGIKLGRDVQNGFDALGMHYMQFASGDLNSQFNFEAIGHIYIDFENKRPVAHELFELVNQASNGFYQMLTDAAKRNGINHIPPAVELNRERIMKALKNEIDEVYGEE